MAEAEWEEDQSGYRKGKVPLRSPAARSRDTTFIGINEDHGGPGPGSGICLYIQTKEDRYADKEKAIAWMSEDEALDVVDAIMELLAHRRDRRMQLGFSS